MVFVNKTTTFGDENNIFGKVFTKALTDGINEIDVADLSKGVKEWIAEIDYKKDMLTYVNEKLYICIADHTAGTDFATDLLAGKWKFIGNGVGSNVTQTELLSNSLKLSANSNETITMLDDITNYDYIVITVKNDDRNVCNIYPKNELYSGSELNTSFFYSNDWFANSYITVVSSTSVKFTVGGVKGYSTVTLATLTGIKITELATDYLAELAMPSGHYEAIEFTGHGQKYTAPANGYMYVSLKPTTLSTYKEIGITTNKATGSICSTPTAGRCYGVTIPITKGTIATLMCNGYSTSNCTCTYLFNYSVGSAKALGLI